MNVKNLKKFKKEAIKEPPDFFEYIQSTEKDNKCFLSSNLLG
ncbi:hypothetical protein [Bacillus cereus]|uniref:Uncharacterized protein n=1 Tax=Bacillus cereus (strain 03BB102) TaxID=572264 RepID=A0A158RFX8_BACC3|nr:hypothetical protein BCA_A0043 [Bacillus cereus 03BB102]